MPEEKRETRTMSKDEATKEEMTKKETRKDEKIREETNRKISEKEKIKDFEGRLAKADCILVGIGQEWKKEGADKAVLHRAYEKIRELVVDKNYFVVTSLDDGEILRAGLDSEKIAAPYLEGKEVSGEDRWKAYTEWLGRTLNHNLLILELGEGFANPGVMRWPFEKVVQLNRKACLFRVHAKFFQLPDNLEGRGVGVAKNSMEWVVSDL